MSDSQNITPTTSDSQPSFEFRIGDRVETDHGTFGTVISIGSLSDSPNDSLQWIWIDFDNGSRGKRDADELTLVAPIENATPKPPAVSAAALPSDPEPPATTEDPSVGDLIHSSEFNYARNAMPRWKRYAEETTFEGDRASAFPDAITALETALKVIDMLLIESPTAANDGSAS